MGDQALHARTTRRLATTTVGDRAKEHLVFVHGFTQNARSWRHIAQALAPTYHVTTIDLPGHGRSTDVVAIDLIDTARLLGDAGGRGTYVGYSLGGRVCLALAVHRPDLVERLVIISGSPGIADPEARLARRLSDAALADRLDPRDRATTGISLEQFLDEWLSGPLFRHLTHAQADRDARLSNSTRGLARSLRSAGVGNQDPLHESLATLSMPVLCIAGADDTRYVAEAQAMVRAIGPGATAAIIDAAGHAVPFEQPDATVTRLRAFLANGRG